MKSFIPISPKTPLFSPSRWLFVGVLVTAFVSSALAAARTSANYGISADVIDSGGRSSTSSLYSNAGSVGTIGGVTSAPSYSTSGGYAGQVLSIKTPVTATLGNLSATYDGLSHAASGSASPWTFIVALTYNGSATAPTNAGTYTVVGTINDATYTGSATGSLVIAKATPVITWATPPDIIFGTALSSAQLNATANTAGTFSYSSASGAVLGAGMQTIDVTFTPTDTTNFNGATAQRSFTVYANAVAPVITTQPLSLPAFVNSSAGFTAAASGGLTSTYQWQKNGINIPGATNAALNFNSVQLTDAGTYSVIATNSAGSVTSKFARLVVIQAQPNAIVYATTISTTGVTAGGTVSLAYFVTNVGTRTWGAGHYLSVRDINGAFVAFSSLIGILPGENTTAVLNFPAPITPGTYTYYVQALEDGVEFFSTQTAVTLTVLAPLANSITFNTTTFPVSAAPGSNVVFTCNVTNTGTQTWGANHLLSLKNSSGTTLSSSLLTVLAPGGSKTVNFSFTAPTAPGTYNYTVQASQTGVGDFNPHADLTLTVLAPRPNAIVYTATRLPDEVVPGATLNLSYSLSNAGTQAWGAGHSVSLRDSSSSFLSFLPLAGIAPGGKKNVAFSFTAPTTPGKYLYYVQALEDGVEFFSTQDVVIITVVSLPLGNAVAYNTSTFPITVSAGATVNFTANVTNRGTRTWGATHYLSFRDVDNTFLAFPSLNGVAPGASRTANLNFTAPTTPGIYTYTLQAFEDGVSFFDMADTVVLMVQ